MKRKIIILPKIHHNEKIFFHFLPIFVVLYFFHAKNMKKALLSA